MGEAVNKSTCDHEKTFITLPIVFSYQTQDDQDAGIKNESVSYSPIRLDSILGMNESNVSRRTTMQTSSGPALIDLKLSFLIKKLHEYGFNFTEEITEEQQIDSIDDLLSNL